MNRRGRERRRLLLLPQVPGCGPRHWVSFQGRSFVKSGLGLQAAGLTASSLFSGLQEEASKARKGRGETRPLIPPPTPQRGTPCAKPAEILSCSEPMAQKRQAD